MMANNQNSIYTHRTYAINLEMDLENASQLFSSKKHGVYSHFYIFLRESWEKTCLAHENTQKTIAQSSSPEVWLRKSGRCAASGPARWLAAGTGAGEVAMVGGQSI